MNLRENNFSFDGLHCMRDFGLIYAENGGHTITPPVTRNSYDISGMSGDILMPGIIYGMHKFAGTLYFQKDPPDQRTAQENLRRIGAWLLHGRKRLQFDYEPQRFYLAEVKGSTKWDYSKWIEGGLEVEFVAQPFAYNVRESSVSIRTTQESNELSLAVDTGEAAPLRLVIANTGTALITGVSVAVHGKKAVLRNLYFASNHLLSIDMNPPIGAVFSSGENALPYAEFFDPLLLKSGANSLTVTLSFGTGTKGATLTASARGRFL